MTNREYEVLKLLKAKKSNEAIAVDLDMDVDVIQLHVESLQRKYGASTRAELIVKASQQD